MNAPSEWVDRFPGLSRLDLPTRQLLTSRSEIVKVPKGTMIFGPGNSPENMLFLLDGTVRVQQVSDTGHQIVLYRIEAGQSCVLTTACLLSYEDYSAEGIAETAVAAAAVPRVVFDDLVAQSKPFRDFVFAAFSKRITDLFQMIDEVAFQRLDVRLADKLISLSNGMEKVDTTHQKLSVELGSAREVISRQLQEFQRRGWIEQARGSISFLDRDQLEKLADHGA
ncbi:Crp/Fnr family transcriptional regulator [Sulfitobacter geojensis]|jgi:CRP/FNR family transcriptional regulator|uniref:Crp/Fnr family transcriptional regulator n=1 Tax=Sulfitobacter geojensis TaxID=1342299 RepID=A0AAE2VXR0_9RHOB|nr:Crp/Fnr family transcriptional regulator [Sulfitobacter geojensis]KHA50546.1 Cyclic nucleotide-binding protein [Sulfitobacter geojensis]MBM1689305.1 Crp/Fnr family transcriptional regulator [Sulfitobacter geojensis]MBM1693371.1 Crp/Fnr family transcriptional regulator [Sulfitobacter geojensis]MBM1705537.1 Crp/Fnr family transcriptional regulator [Sulfitobacter geojensis]MBM1709595.1 Crp/Fnr family transcriptional regulator [Sulfitobacter geojensis]